MCILMAHEIGHFVLCENYDVYATLPFFIPAPTLIGTMGRVYSYQVAHPLRQALFESASPAISQGSLPPSRSCLSDCRVIAPFGMPRGKRIRDRLPAGVSSRVPDREAAHASGSRDEPVGCIHCHCRLGRNVRYRVNLYPRWTTGRRTHRVCGRATCAQAGYPAGDRCVEPAGAVWAAPFLCGRQQTLGLAGLAALGGDSRRHRMASPRCSSWPGLDRTRKWLSLVALLLLVLTFLPSPLVRAKL